MKSYKRILLLPFLLFSIAVMAQKEELYKLNQDLINLVQSNSPLHLAYEITMESTDEPAIKETMESHYYKKSHDIFKMDMGDFQTVFRYKTAMVMADNINGMLFYETDTLKNSGDLLMLAELNALVDSAKSIKKINGKNTVTYVLVFGNTFNYSSINLEYSQSTNLLKSLDARFNQHQGQKYKLMNVAYHSWDLKWQDLDNELQLKNFVENRNGSYQPTGEYKNHKLILAKKMN